MSHARKQFLRNEPIFKTWISSNCAQLTNFTHPTKIKTKPNRTHANGNWIAGESPAACKRRTRMKMLTVTKMTQGFGSRSLGLRLRSGHWLYEPSVFRYVGTWGKLPACLLAKPKS